ncbi:hypothetical protein OIU34_20345 [Pararhizobium sp. BT-229]|uniref:hypothetical protein n=1 Tax=Pararhizobium sp. BT-229 TaxID=2986923 RepID=UPI0021F6B7D9|nr:hypothetical protein [Pararhizobium sp. BT-229]MCV9964239.1 hypothetical protein [Pararhizobium sp. BT-229]
MTITEVGASEAPVAVSWVPPAYRRNSEQCADISGPDGLQLTRWYEGRHWQRLCLGHITSEFRMNSPLMDARTLENALRDWEAQKLLGLRWDGDGLRPKDVADCDPRSGFSDIDIDGREEAIEEVMAAVERLISVDGVLHQTCREPFLVVSDKGRSRGTRQKDFSIEIGEYMLFSEPPSRTDVMPLSEWDGLNAEFEWCRDGKPSEEISRVYGPKIALPDAFTYDWDIAFRVSLLMNRLLQSLHSRGLGTDTAIRKAIASVDAEEQYELISSLPPGRAMTWASQGVDTSCIGKALTILDGRKVTVDFGGPTFRA